MLLPGLGFRDEIIMPVSAMRWVLAQPDDKLSVVEAFAEMDQVAYSLGNKKYVADPWQGANIIRTGMNSALERFGAALNDELGLAFDTFFGTDVENWREIDLLDTIRMIVAQGANRFTIGDSPVGLKLCKSNTYKQ